MKCIVFQRFLGASGAVCVAALIQSAEAQTFDATTTQPAQGAVPNGNIMSRVADPQPVRSVALPSITSEAPQSFDSPQIKTTQGVPIPRKILKERRVDLNFDFITTYDSNVARSSAERARANGFTQADFQFAPIASVDLSIPFSRSVAYLSGSAGYGLYARNTRLNGEQLRANGGVSTDIRRCNIAFDGELSRSRSNVGNLAVITSDPLQTSNYETTNSVGVTAGCGGQVGLAPFASVQYARGVNSNALRRGSNYRTLTYGGGIRYMQPSIGEIGIVGSIEDTHFTARDGSIGTPLSGLLGYPTRSIGAYYFRDVTRFFAAKLRLNYTDVATDQGKSFQGLTGEASIHIAPTGRLKFDAGVHRSALPSLSYNVDYIVETEADFKTTVAVSKRLTIEGGYAYRFRRYFGTTIQTIPLTRDHEQVVSGDAAFQLNRRLQLTFGAAYDTRRANTAFYNYDSTRILAGIRGTF